MRLDLRETALAGGESGPVIVPGRRSWVSDLIHAAGGVSVLGDRDVKSMPLTNEQACALEPDGIVISWCGVRPEKYRPAIVERRPGFGELPAVCRGNVFAIPEAFLGRPGPRLVDGYRALCDAVRVIDERR